MPALHAAPRPGVAGAGHRARPRRFLPIPIQHGGARSIVRASVAAPPARRAGPGERSPCPVALRRIPTGDVASGLPLAPRIRDAPMGSPPGAAPLTPPGPRERLHSMAPRGRHHSAVSRAPGSRSAFARRLIEIAFALAALTSPWLIGHTFPTPTVMRDVGTWP